ncbi:MAG: acyclic terpene utilization AtuA family protein [Pirellulales bacterium]
MTLRIGNGAGFLGDNIDAPRLLAEGAELDYLTLEYLAELTMSILARLREKNPGAGYANDFIEVLASLTKTLARQPRLRIITNAGGVNPRACAKGAAAVLAAAGLDKAMIGMVTGDDLTARLAKLQADGCRFENMDTGQPLSELTQPVVSANAYLGAAPIVRALEGGSRIVITGRVADASLTVGPAVHEFGWGWQHADRLAGASVAGHLIECGAQATGAYLPGWQSQDLANVGYPIAELEPDGSCVITKPQRSSGAVTRQSVAAQLIYEIGDPAHYLTPDVDVDFTTVELQSAGPNRVSVRGATGGPAPDTLKVSLAYRDGYMASGQLLVYGHDCLAKAQACADIIWQRLKRAGLSLRQTHVEFLGTGQAVPGMPAVGEPREIMLRMSARDASREAVERFTREFAPLATSGPAGLAGYTSARGTVRPVFSYWPTLIPRDLVQPLVEVRSAREWVETTG